MSNSNQNQDLKNSNAASESAERLQKVLAAAGYGSRRQCEELIVAGRVEVDREIVHELGTKVDPHVQQVRVDGVTIKPPRMRYFVVNKPTGVISTAKDPWARVRVIDLVESEERLFTVGRLDKESSGLILVTNDGQLANRLAHPRYGIAKTYQVTVVGRPSPEIIRKLKHGIYLSEAFAKMETVTVRKSTDKKTVLEIVLKEGKNREIRRMLARVGHKVVQLKRIALGPIRLGEMPAGSYRELTRKEVNSLQKFDPASGTKKKTRRKPTSKNIAAKKAKTIRKRVPKAGTIIGEESFGQSAGERKKTTKRPSIKSSHQKGKPRIRKTLKKKRTGKRNAGQR